MNKAILIKMKNGRHRVAGKGEIELMIDRDKAISEANNHRSRAFSAISRLNHAREDAANEILKSKFLPEAVNTVIAELTYKYGPELMSHAQQLKRSDIRREPWVNLSASFNPLDIKVMRIRGEIPALRYEVAIMD